MNLVDFLCQQDNDPKHTTRPASEYLDDKDVNMLDRWLLQFSDHNLIENLWYIIKVRSPEKPPKNIIGINEFLWRQWNEIPTEICQNMH